VPAAAAVDGRCGRISGEREFRLRFRASSLRWRFRFGRRFSGGFSGGFPRVFRLGLPDFRTVFRAFFAFVASVFCVAVFGPWILRSSTGVFGGFWRVATLYFNNRVKKTRHRVLHRWGWRVD